jgi:xanthine dehydrogenase accessory factor
MLLNIYDIAQGQLDRNTGICLATLVTVSGSVPQVAGSSALFSEQGLLNGTLGGGVMEGNAGKRAAEAIRTGRHLLYDFHLDAESANDEGALCGGSATILLDPDPGIHMDSFRQMSASLENGQPGLMITVVSNTTETPIRRFWLENDRLNPAVLPGELIGNFPGDRSALNDSINTGKCISLMNEAGNLLFIEPISPLPKLVIAGAGHIGKALAHQGRLLNFEVTVIDDRPEFANSENIPDADHIIVRSIGEAMSEIPKSKDTYIVIVTRGHKDDTEALKACIKHNIPYIGMIGSRKKIRLVKEKLIAGGWSTPEQFDRVHAPIGIEIGSVTVQEIALSITAQLVQVRAAVRKGKKREIIAAVILAAGESRRMGEPKMLLPFGNSTIIGTVAGNAQNSITDHVRVVLGADAEAIPKSLSGLKVELVVNRDYRNGMLSSVQAGLRSLPEATTAVMILLGDQPMISVEIMDRMIERYKQSEKNILIASTNGKRGHPMIFSATYIPEILAYGPEDSLRNLPANHPGEVEEVETGKQEILRDIDTPQDYKNEIKN